MTEIGEAIASLFKSPPADKGSLKVVVKDLCTGDVVDGADVTVNKKTEKTNSSGEATFSDLPTGVANARITKHTKPLDYATFIVHYPRVLNNHEAKTTENDLASIEKNKQAQLEVEIEIFKKVGDIVYHRRHISPKGSDKYGHWWTVVKANKSYGWWPKYPLGSDQNVTSTKPTAPTPPPAGASMAQKIQYKFDSAVYSAKLKIYEMKESSPMQTLRGVDGELNGQTSFGGTPTRDPHHIGGDAGDEQYHPVRKDCFDPVTIEAQIDRFAGSYAGGWSWRLEAGNHCHTFQKELMKTCDLDKVKVIK